MAEFYGADPVALEAAYLYAARGGLGTARWNAADCEAQGHVPSDHENPSDVLGYAIGDSWRLHGWGGRHRFEGGSGIPGQYCPGCGEQLEQTGLNGHGQRTVGHTKGMCDWTGVDARDL